jgi:hypothetical protein
VRGLRAGKIFCVKMMLGLKDHLSPAERKSGKSFL